MADIEPKEVLEAGAKALFGPVNDLFMKLTGPAAEEYGLMWGDSVRFRRTKRFVNGLIDRSGDVVGVQATYVQATTACRMESKFSLCVCYDLCLRCRCLLFS
jgi:hypothetical protein